MTEGVLSPAPEKQRGMGAVCRDPVLNGLIDALSTVLCLQLLSRRLYGRV